MTVKASSLQSGDTQFDEIWDSSKTVVGVGVDVCGVGVDVCGVGADVCDVGVDVRAVLVDVGVVGLCSHPKHRERRIMAKIQFFITQPLHECFPVEYIGNSR